MAKIPRLKVIRYPLIDIDGTTSYTGSEITKSLDLTTKAGIELNKDTFDFKIKSTRNPNTNIWDTPILKNNIQNNILNKGEFVTLYAWYGAIEPTDDELNNNHLLMHGVINTFDAQADTSNVSITVKGANSTEELLNTMVPYSSIANSGSYNTCPTAIKFMITQRANEFNTKRPVYAFFDNEINPFTGSYGNIVATKSDGSAFPTIDYAKVYTPLFKQIEELSTTEYTEDIDVGTYQFYIKPVKVLPSKYNEVGSVINELVWQPKSLTKLGSLVEGYDFTQFKLSLDVRNVYNAFIYNAGTDFNGVGIVGVAYNATSMGKYGAKWKYYTEKRQMFSDLYTLEKNAGIAAGSTYTDTSPYPDAVVAGSSWTFLFQGRDTNSGTKTGSSAVSTSVVEFNNTLRNEAKWSVHKISEEITLKEGEPRFRVDVELPTGSNLYQMGDVYEIQIPSLGWDGSVTNPGYNLRLVDTNHKFNTEGWKTSLTFDEDEYTISEQLN